MKHLVNNKVNKIKIPAIREYSERAKLLPNSIDLTIGQPDFNTPEHIKVSGKQAIDRNKTSYTNNAGTEHLRKSASQYIFNKYGLTYSSEEVLITNGATQALDTTFRTILEEGSEVILPGPVYLGYQPLIEMCGATPVFIDTTENDFKMTADLIQKKITEKTRCILLSYPSNPVGVTLNNEELGEIANLIKNKNIFIVSDEIYSELIYEQNHNSIASFPEAKEKTVVINGLSKSHSMTGWRIGFLFAPEYLIEEMIKVHLFNTSCACSISQEAAFEAIENGKDDPLLMKVEYRKRRDYVYSRLISMGLDVIKPQAAFYIFPSIKKFSCSSIEFANKLLNQEHVAIVPGSSFSEIGEYYIRISFASSMDVLKEGLNRIENFINFLEKNPPNGD